MPQVAARINAEQEKWLKEYFRTKNAGAEFILPWAVDVFFRAMILLKREFTPNELKVIVAAHKDTRLMPDTSKVSYLKLRLAESFEVHDLHRKFAISKDTLCEKIDQLDDTQATALMVWASAFWVSKECTTQELDEYIAE